MIKLIEFLFFRWKKEVVGRGAESWISTPVVGGVPMSGSSTRYARDWVDYKYTNKFDGSTKIKRKYLN
jgi:hypothetical protein